MGRKYIKKSDAIRVNAYLALTNSFITIRDGYWEVQTPQETWYCKSTQDLIDEINVDLEELAKVVDADTYNAAFENDGRLTIR